MTEFLAVELLAVHSLSFKLFVLPLYEVEKASDLVELVEKKDYSG